MVKWCYFDSLDVFGLVNKLYLRFICVVRFKMIEINLLWDNFEFILIEICGRKF